MTWRTLLPGFVTAALTAALMLFGVVELAELSMLNRLLELRGPRPPAAPIVIVTIDEDSFDELNLPWPFPRALHGRLVDALSRGRPLAIGLDIFFPEPSARGPADDAALGAAVARAGNVVLGAAITGAVESFYKKEDSNLPLPVIRRGAAAVAPVNALLDHDGHIRRAPLRHRVADETLDSWDVALYRVARARGLPVAPLPDTDVITINYRGGPRTFPWVPYHRVVNGDIPPEAFAGTIVLVGATTPLLQDVFSTPFAPARAMPGVEIHANVLDNFVRGDHLRVVPGWASVLGAVAATIAAAVLAARLRALRGFAAVAVLLGILAAATVVALAVWGFWFRAVGVTVGLLLGYGATVLDTFSREQREKRRLSPFFSPAVLREIVRHREGEALGSSRRLLTVLFSDLRGFTSLSERVEPEQVVEMLHEYLTEMTEVVFRHGGTVDKYIGDCIMALYNVPFEDPDHAANAIRTALELQERTLELSARWEARLGVEIRNGVGINTGEAIVGTMGSRQRLEYTAIGDTVNLASRLESLTKEHGTSIIISETTHDAVKGRFLTRELGAVAVRGKARPVTIYGVLPGDLRKYPRAALAMGATLVAASRGRTCVVQTRDVGAGGLSVAGLPDDWLVGDAIEIRCEGGSLPKPLVANGRIAWRRHDVAGIAFTALDPDAEPGLTEYVTTHRRA